MERIDSKTVYEGTIIDVRVDRFRYDDGEEADREIATHPGAVAIAAYDDDVVWLVRQPREAVGQPDLLELPAGKLDVEGESALETARRELAEEIGQVAEHWIEVESYYSSSGYSDELVHVFAATGLRPSDDAVPDPAERIVFVRWPLADLDAAIAESNDAKTLIGLGWLRATLGS